jgi:heme/copper-type cytochrome/quinol oxidase subunit 2
MLRRCFSSAVLALAFLFPVVAWPCAVCLTGASANDPVADAFNWSVLFLMAAPYTIVGSVGGWLAYTHWRAARKRDGKLKRKVPVLRLAWIHKESGR